MNPVMLITGASRGLGARFAAGFAARGYRVAINFSRSKLEAERLRAEIAEVRGAEEVMTVQADVGRRDEVRRMFDRIEADWGEVEVLINNAGLNMDGPFLAMTDEQWERVIATNLTGTFLCSQEYALRYKGNSGRILNLGAATALHGRKNGANYCSAKAGVIALTKCLALELAPRIAVNCLVPGYIETDEVVERYNLKNPARRAEIEKTIPMGRLGTPDDVFRTAEFIITAADYVTGQNFFVNGGNFMP